MGKCQLCEHHPAAVIGGVGYCMLHLPRPAQAAFQPVQAAGREQPTRVVPRRRPR